MKEPLLVQNDLPPAPERSRPGGSARLPVERPSRVGAADVHAIFSANFTRALLVLSVLMFGVIIGMKVSDYFHGRYFEEQELALMQHAMLQSAERSGAAESTAAAPPPSAAISRGSAAALPTGIVFPPVAEAPPAAGPPARLAPTEIPAATATGSDYGDQLAALQLERELVSERFEELANRGNPGHRATAPLPPPASAPNGSARPTAKPRRSSALSILPQEQIQMTETSPARSDKLDPTKQRIKDAPALAKVVDYDQDWHFVVINGGSKRNLTPGRKLAVRRGHEILGLIQIDEVLEDQSVAELTGNWRSNPKLPRPAQGDDIVSFPLF